MNAIAIIGSGPTAIYTAQYLLAKGCNLSIVIFEKQDEAGKGTPYHPDWNEKEMLANIASIEIPALTQTLVDWMESHSDRELDELGVARADINERAFFPRVALGEYFHDQLEKLKQKARINGNSLHIKTNHKVLDINLIDDGAVLTVREDDGAISDHKRLGVRLCGYGYRACLAQRNGSAPWIFPVALACAGAKEY